VTSPIVRVAELAGFASNAARVSAWLERYGYWQAAAEELLHDWQSGDWGKILNRAVEFAMNSHGGASVADLVDRPRCGCSDLQMLRGRGAAALNQWPRGYVVRVWLGDLPRGTLTASDWADIFGMSLKAWSDVCGFKWEIVTSKPADGFSVFSENEDGPSKVLAWCELPTAGVRLYRMKLDESEHWVKSGNGILALNVVTHELGHGIGLDHIAESSGKALMNPYYDPQVSKPLSLDIAQAKLRYGEPATTPVPVPTPIPTPTPTSKIMSWIDGKRYVVTEAA
jgi:hypothetical protein